MSMLPDVFVPSSQWSWNIDLEHWMTAAEEKKCKT